MRFLYKFCMFVLFISLLGCESFKEPVRETSEGYQIQRNTNLTVILQTPLSSNLNQRGDSFITKLKQPLIFKDKTILSKDTQIRGLVKRVTKFEKLGDRARLLLLFDQIALPDKRRIPLEASLDTDKGEEVIKIRGKGVHDAKVIGGSALVGALVGKTAIKEKGAEKGLVIGATVGTGAVILSNIREVKLPEGTELIIKIDESVLIPKKF